MQVRAEHAYGYYDPHKVVEYDLTDFPAGQSLRPGEEIVMCDKKGQQISLRVLEIGEDIIKFDGNHPLAGQDLVFEIEATDARDATAEELGGLETGTDATKRDWVRGRVKPYPGCS